VGQRAQPPGETGRWSAVADLLAAYQESLFVGSDSYGQYLTCGNCGWSRDLDQAKPLPKVTDIETDRKGIPDGCNVSPSCFQCPLPDCAYETPTTRATYVRDQHIIEELGRHQYLGAAQAVEITAQVMGVSARTVFRTLARRKKRAA
jgi:hypothetical protein